MRGAYIPSLAFATVAGVAAFLVAWRRAGARADARVLASVFTTALTGLIGGRLYALIEQGWRWELTAGLEGGLRMPGAVAGLLVGLWFWRRIFVPDVPLGRIGDVGAVAAQCAFAVARLGCLSAGCCFGTHCGLPWALRFPRGTEAADVHAAMGWVALGEPSLPVHPLALYFVLLHAALALFLIWLLPRRTYDGQVLLVSVLIAQGGKAVLETLRQPLGAASTGHLQVASALLACAAAALLITFAFHRPRAASHQRDQKLRSPNRAPGGIKEAASVARRCALHRDSDATSS